MFQRGERVSSGRRIVSFFILLTFLMSVVMPPQVVQAQILPTFLNLPAPGSMITPSNGYVPSLIKGITIHPEDPLKFDFLVSRGDDQLDNQALRVEGEKMVKYFLAALTVPEEEMWVNLSPYEKDRIIPESFRQTEMGRDLLAQDYMLKQLSASLAYPEDEVGSRFWTQLQAKAQAAGLKDIPTDVFHKIWIVPSKAVVYEHGQSAFVVESYLKVMLEADYLALMEAGGGAKDEKEQGGIATELLRQELIPIIEKEVNQGETFTKLRQIMQAVILAAWYKENLQNTLLGQVYVDQRKTRGIDLVDKESHQKIYAQYLEAFQKGVYNYIKEEYDPATQAVIPKKYFSGGAQTAVITTGVLAQTKSPQAGRNVNAALAGDEAMITVSLRTTSEGGLDKDFAMVGKDEKSQREQFRIDDLVDDISSKIEHSDAFSDEAFDELLDNFYDKNGGDNISYLLNGLEFLNNRIAGVKRTGVKTLVNQMKFILNGYAEDYFAWRASLSNEQQMISANKRWNSSWQDELTRKILDEIEQRPKGITIEQFDKLLDYFHEENLDKERSEYFVAGLEYLNDRMANLKSEDVSALIEDVVFIFKHGPRQFGYKNKEPLISRINDFLGVYRDMISDQLMAVSIDTDSQLVKDKTRVDVFKDLTPVGKQELLAYLSTGVFNKSTVADEGYIKFDDTQYAKASEIRAAKLIDFSAKAQALLVAKIKRFNKKQLKLLELYIKNLGANDNLNKIVKQRTAVQFFSQKDLLDLINKIRMLDHMEPIISNKDQAMVAKGALFGDSAFEVDQAQLLTLINEKIAASSLVLMDNYLSAAYMQGRLFEALNYNEGIVEKVVNLLVQIAEKRVVRGDTVSSQMISDLLNTYYARPQGNHQEDLFSALSYLMDSFDLITINNVQGVFHEAMLMIGGGVETIFNERKTMFFDMGFIDYSLRLEKKGEESQSYQVLLEKDKPWLRIGQGRYRLEVGKDKGLKGIGIDLVSTFRKRIKLKKSFSIAAGAFSDQLRIAFPMYDIAEEDSDGLNFTRFDLLKKTPLAQDITTSPALEKAINAKLLFLADETGMTVEEFVSSHQKSLGFSTEIQSALVQYLLNGAEVDDDYILNDKSLQSKARALLIGHIFGLKKKQIKMLVNFLMGENESSLFEIGEKIIKNNKRYRKNNSYSSRQMAEAINVLLSRIHQRDQGQDEAMLGEEDIDRMTRIAEDTFFKHLAVNDNIASFVDEHREGLKLTDEGFELLQNYMSASGHDVYQHFVDSIDGIEIMMADTDKEESSGEDIDELRFFYGKVQAATIGYMLGLDMEYMQRLQRVLSNRQDWQLDRAGFDLLVSDMIQTADSFSPNSAVMENVLLMLINNLRRRDHMIGINVKEAILSEEEAKAVRDSYQPKSDLIDDDSQANKQPDKAMMANKPKKLAEVTEKLLDSKSDFHLVRVVNMAVDLDRERTALKGSLTESQQGDYNAAFFNLKNLMYALIVERFKVIDSKFDKLLAYNFEGFEKLKSTKYSISEELKREMNIISLLMGGEKIFGKQSLDEEILKLLDNTQSELKMIAKQQRNLPFDLIENDRLDSFINDVKRLLSEVQDGKLLSADQPEIETQEVWPLPLEESLKLQLNFVKEGISTVEDNLLKEGKKYAILDIVALLGRLERFSKRLVDMKKDNPLLIDATLEEMDLQATIDRTYKKAEDLLKEKYDAFFARIDASNQKEQRRWVSLDPNQYSFKFLAATASFLRFSLGVDSLVAITNLKLGLECNYWLDELFNIQEKFNVVVLDDEAMSKRRVLAGMMIDNSKAKMPEQRWKKIELEKKYINYNEGEDKAMIGQREVGGIDMNRAHMDLQIKRDGNGIVLPLIDQPLEALENIQGFVPVIINIVPATNMPLLLGLLDEEPNDSDYSQLRDLEPFDLSKK